MGHEVFISYSAEDKLTAEAVCKALEFAIGNGFDAQELDEKFAACIARN